MENTLDVEIGSRIEVSNPHPCALTITVSAGDTGTAVICTLPPVACLTVVVGTAAPRITQEDADGGRAGLRAI